MAEKSQEIRDMEKAEKDYRKAKSAYDSTASSAKSALKKAERGRSKDIRQAEKALYDEKDRLSKPLGSFAGTKLYWDHIENKDSSLALEEGMSVEVNASGNTYTAVANPGHVQIRSSNPLGKEAGDISDDGIAASATHDTRNLFIVLKTSVNAMTVNCDPDDEKEARDYADAIVSAASRLTQQAEVNRRMIDDAHQNVAQRRADTQEVDDAKSSMVNAKADTADLDDARSRFEQAQARVSRAELRAYRKRKRRNRAIAVAVVVLVVLIVAVVLYMLLR